MLAYLCNVCKLRSATQPNKTAAALVQPAAIAQRKWETKTHGRAKRESISNTVIGCLRFGSRTKRHRRPFARQLFGSHSGRVVFLGYANCDRIVSVSVHESLLKVNHGPGKHSFVADTRVVFFSRSTMATMPQPQLTRGVLRSATVELRPPLNKLNQSDRH